MMKYYAQYMLSIRSLLFSTAGLNLGQLAIELSFFYYKIKQSPGLVTQFFKVKIFGLTFQVYFPDFRQECKTVFVYLFVCFTTY